MGILHETTQERSPLFVLRVNESLRFARKLSTIRQHCLMCFFFPTGLDYKKLIAVGSPLQILKPVLTSANVHLLAKLANKIPTQVSEVVCRVRSLSLSRLLKMKKFLSFSYCILSKKSYCMYFFLCPHSCYFFPSQE